MPFDDSVNENKVNSGLKLDNKKSMFSKNTQDKEFLENSFKQNVENHQNNDEKIKGRITELSTKFMEFVRDQTLSENKSPIQLDLERDISRQLTDLAMQLNNDETKPEGIGSAGMIMLLLRCTLTQRDIINKLAYKIHQLESEKLKNHKGL
jgi:hypothetical protein